MHAQMWVSSWLLFGGLASAIQAQPKWAQCGGQNWKGATTCARGLSCVIVNQWYSQCQAVSGNPNANGGKKTTTRKTSSTSKPLPTLSLTDGKPSPAKPTPSSRSIKGTTTKSRSASKTNRPGKFTRPTTYFHAADGSAGASYKASITFYGAGDTFGSPNCNTNTAACGFYTYPGYSAAVSQNLYGVGPGAGAGPACGTCWKLTGETDSSGNQLSNAGTSIVVMVNNLCPAQGNPLCSQPDLTSTNQYGANVNFDLCSDSGARAAFFGDSGVGLAIGTAQQVDCSEWTGEVKEE